MGQGNQESRLAGAELGTATWGDVELGEHDYTMKLSSQDLLDQVLRSAMFAAEDAVTGKEFRTPADRTRAAVTAAFKLALANKLITIVPAEEWPEFIQLDLAAERDRSG